VLETTGSAVQPGLTAFAGTLPLVIGAFFGGALVDRIGHKRAIISADLISGIMVALIPLLYHTVGLAFWQLPALVFLGALLDIPGATAHKALMPELAALARLRLEKANAAFATIERGSLLVGPILAGVLIAGIGASNVLWYRRAKLCSIGGVSRPDPGDTVDQSVGDVIGPLFRRSDRRAALHSA
jgi:MFS family permease